MDDTQQAVQPPTNQTSQTQPTAQPDSQPISAPIKEAEPFVVSEITPTGEGIKPSEPEPELSQEVKDAGVQVVSIPPPLYEKIGVMPSAESTPVAPALDSLSQVMTKEEIVTSQKLPPTNSARWLSELMTKIWSQLTSKKQESHS